MHAFPLRLAVPVHLLVRSLVHSSVVSLHSTMRSLCIPLYAFPFAFPVGCLLRPPGIRSGFPTSLLVRYTVRSLLHFLVGNGFMCIPNVFAMRKAVCNRYTQLLSFPLGFPVCSLIRSRCIRCQVSPCAMTMRSLEHKSSYVIIPYVFPCIPRLYLPFPVRSGVHSPCVPLYRQPGTFPHTFSEDFLPNVFARLLHPVFPAAWPHRCISPVNL